MLRSQDAHLFQFSSEKQALIYRCCSSSICAGFKILAGGTITFLLAAMVPSPLPSKKKKPRVELANCAFELRVVSPRSTIIHDRGTFRCWIESKKKSAKHVENVLRFFPFLLFCSLNMFFSSDIMWCIYVPKPECFSTSVC